MTQTSLFDPPPEPAKPKAKAKPVKMSKPKAPKAAKPPEHLGASRYRLHLMALHLFEPAPFWGTPGPDAQRLWLPTEETARSLLDEWEAQTGQRRAS